MVAEEMAEPRPAYLLNRGEYDNRGEPVDRLVPAALPPLPNDARETGWDWPSGSSIRRIR